jgi:hypothetical protein
MSLLQRAHLGKNAIRLLLAAMLDIRVWINN